MGRAKLTDAEAAASYQRRLEATRQRRLATQNEPSHAPRPHAITLNTSIQIAGEETETEPGPTADNTASAAATELSTRSIAAVGETASGNGNYNLRSRKSPTPLSSIGSGASSPAQEINSGRASASSHDGPLHDARETSVAVETIDMDGMEGEAAAETFGLEALALSDEVNAAEWEEDGLFMPLNDDAGNTPSLDVTEPQVKQEESEARDTLLSIAERLSPVANREERESEGINAAKHEREADSSDIGSAAEYTPDTSDRDESPRISVAPSHRPDQGYTSTTPGDFLQRQAHTYKTIFQDAFAATCRCKYYASI